MHDDFIIFCGTASESLGNEIAELFERRPGACSITRFPDGELNIRLNEPVRGKEVYLVQSTCPPVDEHLVELLAMTDACRRAGASRIIAVVPYFGYARADKRDGQLVPVTGSMVAALMETAGVNHLLSVDLHAAQIEGFFRIPVDTVTSVEPLCDFIRKSLSKGTVVISPDAGRVKMATEFARALALPLVLLHKERGNEGSAHVTHVVGEVRNRPCLIIDDMISTGGTVLEAIESLLKAGAHDDIMVAATHALFVKGARERLKHPAIREIIVSDSIPLAGPDWPKVKVVSLAPVLATAIQGFRETEWIVDLIRRPVQVEKHETIIGDTSD